VVVQSDRLTGLDTVTICPLTTSVSEELPARPIMEADPTNGLRARSQAMVDKLMTVRLRRVGPTIGHLSDQDLARIDLSLRYVLGLAET
jgi:mRNA interferase MazF